MGKFKDNKYLMAYRFNDKIKIFQTKTKDKIQKT